MEIQTPPTHPHHHHHHHRPTSLYLHREGEISHHRPDANLSTCRDSPRIVRARRRLSRLLAIRMENEVRMEKVPSVHRTPSFLQKLTHQKPDKRTEPTDKSESANILRHNARWRSIHPSASLTDVSTTTTTKTPRLLRRSFSTSFSNKTSVDGETKNFETIAVQCIHSDDCKLLKSTLKRKLVNPNTTIDGASTLMHEAAYKGCTKCIKALTKHGGEVNAVDDSGWTPLHASVFGQQLDAVKILLELDSCVDCLSCTGWTPLHLGVFFNDLFIVHELITNGADPLQLPSNNVTPFQLAINLNKTLILDYFVQLPCFLVKL